MSGLWCDARWALRQLRSRPSFSITAIGILTLALGANLASFTIVHALFLGHAPLPRAGELVRIYSDFDKGPDHFTVSYPNYEDVAALTNILSAVVAEKPMPFTWRNDDGPHRIWGSMVSPNYFEGLEVPMRHGRGFSVDEAGSSGHHAVAVLAHRFWVTQLGAQVVIGESILLNGQRFTITGIADKGFDGMFYGLRPAIWVSASMESWLVPGSDRRHKRGGAAYFVLARLAEGNSVASARAALQVLGSRLQQDHPETNRGVSFSVLSERQGRVHPWARGGAFGVSGVLLLAVLAVLLVACANLAGLQFAHLRSRQRELATRAALGATRFRLVRQLLSESLLLVVVAVNASVVLGRVLVLLVSHIHLPVDRSVGLAFPADASIVPAIVALVIGTTMLFGLAPALFGARTRLADWLGNRPGAGTSPMRKLLLGIQLGVSGAILFGALALFENITGASRVDVGFDPRGLAMVSVDPTLGDFEKTRLFFEQAVRELEERPGVSSVGVATAMPFDLNIVRARVTPVESRENNDSGLSADIVFVGHRYFGTMGIPVTSGRGFTLHDDAASERVAIVNETLASRLWPDGAAVGRSLQFGDKRYRVVGIVPTGKYLSLSESDKPWLFVPFQQSLARAATLVLRHRDSEGAALAELRRTVARLNPEIPLYNDRTMSEQLSVPLLPSRLGWYLMASFGLVALALSGLGLYGTMSYWVALREKEIGVRRALGAGAKEVTRLLLREVSASLFAGAVVFMIAAALVRRALHSVLVTAVASEWVLHTVVLAAVFGGTLTVSSLLAARRALRIDPARALAAER